MAFNYIPQYNLDQALNRDVDGINCAEGWAAQNINNCLRSQNSQAKREHALLDTVASAGTTDITASGAYTVSGSNAITAFTVISGSRRRLIFSGAATLTHDGDAIICPGGQNIVTAAGDACDVVAHDTNKVTITNYMRASGIPIVASSSATDGYVLTSNGPGTAPTWQENIPSAAGSSVIGSGRRVIGQWSTNSDYVVRADELVIKDTSGNARLVTLSAFTTGVITVSGISGLDTSTEASNTHYYVWVIDRTTPRAAVAVTADSGTDTFTDTAHGMANNTPIMFAASGSLPTGVSASAIYYTRNVATDSYQISASVGGSAVNFSTNGSGITVSTVPAILLSTSSTAPTMPSGYTYKALVSWVRNDNSSNFIFNYMRDRRVTFTNQNILTAGAVTTPGTFEGITITSYVPPIALAVSGVCGRSDTAAGATYGIAVSGDGGNAWQGWGASNETTALLSFGGRGNFNDVNIATTGTTTLYWTASVTSAFGRIDLNGFTF